MLFAVWGHNPGGQLERSYTYVMNGVTLFSILSLTHRHSLDQADSVICYAM